MRDSGKPRPMTAAERRAWRMGFIAGVGHSTGALEMLRIRFAACGLNIDVPLHWPVVPRAKRRPVVPRAKRRAA